MSQMCRHEQTWPQEGGQEIKFGPSIREAVFVHSQGNDHPLVRPVKSYDAAKLRGHTSMHQLASEAF